MDYFCQKGFNLHVTIRNNYINSEWVTFYRCSPGLFENVHVTKKKKKEQLKISQGDHSRLKET